MRFGLVFKRVRDDKRVWIFCRLEMSINRFLGDNGKWSLRDF